MSQEDLDILDRYLRNELDEKSKILVESRLASDATFRELWQDLVILQNSLEINRRRELLGKMQQWNRDKKMLRGHWFLNPISIAATVLILIGLGFVIWKPWSKTSPEELAVKYFAYPELSISRGTDEQDSLKWMAYEFYLEEKYRDSELKLRTYLHSTADPEASFLLGVILTGAEFFDTTAISILRAALRPPNAIEEVNWYLALAYLRSNKPDRAIDLLGQLSAEVGIFQEKSRNLKRELEGRL
jgi:hypothetical protein